MDAVILDAMDNSLSIEVTENGYDWTYFHLIGQQTTYLGADIASRLANLRDWLRAEDISDWKPQCKFDGIPGHQLFLLSEKHHILYAGVDGADHILTWYNAGVDHPVDELMVTGTSLDSDAIRLVPVAGIMRLSPEHQKKWVEALTAILESL